MNMTFENIVGKEENAGNQHFLLFPQRFLPFKDNFLFLGNILLSSTKAFCKNLKFNVFKP